MLNFYMLRKTILSTRFHHTFSTLLPKELNEIRKKLLMQNLKHNNQNKSIINFDIPIKKPPKIATQRP